MITATSLRRSRWYGLVSLKASRLVSRSRPGTESIAWSTPDLLAGVEAVIARLDAIRPDETASDPHSWADLQARGLAAASGGLAPDATRALSDLLSWQRR